MEAEQPLFMGELVGVSLQGVLIPRVGWTVTVRRTWEYSRPGAPEVEHYDRLTRGEMLDVVDALRSQLDFGTEV